MVAYKTGQLEPSVVKYGIRATVSLSRMLCWQVNMIISGLQQLICHHPENMTIISINRKIWQVSNNFSVRDIIGKQGFGYYH